jgi:hypothetical protein
MQSSRGSHPMLELARFEQVMLRAEAARDRLARSARPCRAPDVVTLRVEEFKNLERPCP